MWPPRANTSPCRWQAGQAPAETDGARAASPGVIVFVRPGTASS